MLIVGDRDPVIRPSMLEGHEAHAGAMTVEIVPRVGHFLPEEAPDVIAQFARSMFEPWRTEHATLAAGGIVKGVDHTRRAPIEGPTPQGGDGPTDRIARRRS